MDQKGDPQKIDFWRILRRVRADPGGVCGPHLALEIEESDFLSCTPCTPEGAADHGKRASSTIDVALQSAALYRGLSGGGLGTPRRAAADSIPGGPFWALFFGFDFWSRF